MSYITLGGGNELTDSALSESIPEDPNVHLEDPDLASKPKNEKKYNEPMKQNQKEIPFCVPYINEKEIKEVVKVLQGKWITTGAEVKKFEEKIRKYVKWQEKNDRTNEQLEL